VKTAVLTGILLLGLILRTVWLDKYPPGLTPDEAAFGYNAYSVLQTGSDEWGTPWYRLAFTNLRSFGDYKLPMYVFLALFPVKIFGLSEFAVRLPNALIGTLAVAAVYLLGSKLFSAKTALWAAFLLAVSPWHIQLSRGAFEANLVTFFLPLGIYLFLTGSAVWSALVLGLNFYSYHSARLLTPLIVIILLMFKLPGKINRLIFIAALFIVTVPGLVSMTSGSIARVSDIGITGPTDNWRSVADRRFTARQSGLPDGLARLISNKVQTVTSLYIHNYLTYFSGQFLFTSGASEGTYGMLPGRGVLYIIELPLLLYFLVLLIRKPSPQMYLLLLLLLISPIPAALTKGPGYAANRAVVMLPFLILAISFGLTHLIKNKLLTLITITVYSLCLLFFLANYLYLSPSQIAPAMLYGRREALTRVASISGGLEEVRISRSLSEPHIYLAFFSRFSPAEYQMYSRNWPDPTTLGLKFLDQVDGYSLDKYRFGNLNFEAPVDHSVLYVGLPSDFPPDYPGLFRIDYPDGRPAVTVAAKNP